MQELEHYVTERHNPENLKGVKHVDVRYPSPYLNSLLGVDVLPVAVVPLTSNAWRLEEDHKMTKVFTAMSARFTGKTNTIIRDIRTVTARLFDIGVETFESPESLRAETHL